MARSSSGSDRAYTGVGGWLGGPGARPDGSQPGKPRLELPSNGPGSAVGMGRKLVGTLVDLFAALLIGRVIVLVDPHPGVNAVTGAQTLAFLLEVWLLQASTGQSVGQRFTHTRVEGVNGGRAGTWWLLARGVLMVGTCFIVGLFTDADGRGLQDRVAGTVIVATE